MTTTIEQTTEQPAPYDKDRLVKVGDVEGHPFYFNTESGTLVGNVRGERIEHKTLSTLRRLMFAQHIKTLENIPCLVVAVPDVASDYAVRITADSAQLVSKQAGGGFQGADRMIAADGSRYDVSGKYAVVPTDSGQVEQIKREIEDYEREVDAETKRHKAAVLDISTRWKAYAEQLRAQFPESAVSARLPELQRNSDRLAYVNRGR